MRTVAALAVPVVPYGVSAAALQENGPELRTAFDIPAQPLDSALADYFRLTGVQLLYDSQLTLRRRSGVVRGKYTPREALALLLRGTGLVARYTRATAAVITTPGRGAILPQPPLVPLGRVIVREKIAPARLTPIDRLAYYGRLENALQAYLRADPRAQRLNTSVRVAIRIAESGKITEVRIDHGAGKDVREERVGRALLGRIVAPPPPGMAQPLLVALRGRPSGAD